MSTAHRYFARAPRYVFQADDGTLVRFAPMQTKGVISRAVIQDLSESGLSFTLPITEDLSSLPDEGAAIKIEFPIPGSPKGVACFATVVRVEQRTEWMPEWGERGFHLIALQFRHLPKLHLKAIQRGLNGRVHNEDDSDFNFEKRPHVVALIAATAALAACAYVLTFSAHTWTEFFHRLF